MWVCETRGRQFDLSCLIWIKARKSLICPLEERETVTEFLKENQKFPSTIIDWIIMNYNRAPGRKGEPCLGLCQRLRDRPSSRTNWVPGSRPWTDSVYLCFLTQMTGALSFLKKANRINYRSVKKGQPGRRKQLVHQARLRKATTTCSLASIIYCY
jgi:hypothetical protein